jgi:SAM-dependent methyltransferase
MNRHLRSNDRDRQAANPSAAPAHRQQQHFETIHDAYVSHYYDAASMAYREEFILGPLLEGIDLNHKTVAEIACGSGYNSLYLKGRFPGISLHGFDISPRACADYENNVGAPCSQVDLTIPGTPPQRFDVAIVVGGLHHCVTDLPMTLRNLGQMIEPGGLLLMMEPNSDYMLEAVRKFWYRHDSMFEHESEAALNYEEIAAMASADFVPEMVRHGGGPAFFAIYNSMVLRVPHGLKPYIAPPLTLAERAWSRLPMRVMHAMFLARWRRRGSLAAVRGLSLRKAA